jgi:hypothetical protein
MKRFHRVEFPTCGITLVLKKFRVFSTSDFRFRNAQSTADATDV